MCGIDNFIAYTTYNTTLKLYTGGEGRGREGKGGEGRGSEHLLIVITLVLLIQFQ